MAIKQYLDKLLEGTDLTFEESGDLLDNVFTGEVPPAQVAAFLTALRVKGETVEELAGLASSLRSHAVKVETGIENLVDVVGTGGAAVKTFNVSTAAALVAAGAGVHVRGGVEDQIVGGIIEQGPNPAEEITQNHRHGLQFVV